MSDNSPEETDNIKNNDKIEASIESYDVSALMTQTRLLAANYREQTGNALPVTEELARFDAINLIGLTKLTEQEGIDAIDPKTKETVLVKGRVIFKGGKARQKLGKLGLQAEWQQLLMVIYNPQYEPTQIFQIDRKIIELELNKLPVSKRGSMTVAKYKAIGTQVWQSDTNL